MDAYAECPCGSGKKVKFCCHEIIHEMQKVERLRENQPRLAISMLEDLRHSHPQNAWVVTTEALLQIQADDPAAARKSLAPFLKQHPAHPRANAIYALACARTDGCAASRKIANRAFKLVTPATMPIVCVLSYEFFLEHRNERAIMAARQMLSLAIRLSQDPEQRDNSIKLMMMLDADRKIPWPLRGVHSLPEFTPSPETEENINKARRLSGIGCFDEAAELLKSVAAQEPERAEVWHALGLNQAWVAEHREAAESLHRAAELYTDPHTAVECEVLAQLLDSPEKVFTLQGQTRVAWISDLQVALDRIEAESNILGQEPYENEGIQGYTFDVYSRDPRDSCDKNDSEAWSIHLGKIMLVGKRGDSTMVQVSELESVGCLTELTDRLFSDLLIAISQEEEPASESEEVQATEPTTPPAEESSAAEAHSPAAEPEDEFGSGILLDQPEQAQEVSLESGQAPPEEAAAQTATSEWMNYPMRISALERLTYRWAIPQELSSKEHHRLFRTVVDQFVTNTWAETPQSCLKDKSPREAVHIPELQIRLEAAVLVLDALCHCFDLPVSRELLQSYAGIVPPMMEIGAQENMGGYSLFRLQRINLETLSDTHLDHVIGRADIAQLPWPALAGLRIRLTRRRHAAERVSDLFALSKISEEIGELDQAIEWMRKAIESAGSTPNPFEALLGCKVRLVNLWMTHDPTHQECMDLLTDLWHNFGQKVPRLREQLIAAVQEAGIDPPWDKAILIADVAGSVSTSSEPKKLILPGMN